MKEKLKLIGIIAIIAVIGLAMAACGDDEPCDHQWGEWDVPSDSISFRECTICGEKDYCYCDHYGDWVASGNTASRNCTTCERAEGLTKEHFYGTWKHTTGSGETQTIVISENDFYLTTTQGAVNANYYRYTGTNLTWTPHIFDKPATTDSVTNEPISSTTFPVGFGLGGGTGTAAGTWAANAGGSAWVYMKTTGDAIVIRITDALITRTYTFTLAN